MKNEKIFVHRYQLPWSRQSSRHHGAEGALIALQTAHGIGYADLHPWTTLGDLSLDQQWASYERGNPTDQLQRSLEWARRDARARADHRIGISYAPIANHHLILEAFLDSKTLIDSLQHQSPPQVVKWKISPSTVEENITHLHATMEAMPSLRWRLDANALFNGSQIIAFWQSLSSDLQQRIEFIEDPCPFQKLDWEGLAQRGIPLAMDFEIKSWQKYSLETTKSFREAQFQPLIDSGPCTLILKPAIQNMEFWYEWLELNPNPVVLTSYLDHPVGLLHALWEAEIFQRRFPHLLQICGLNLSLKPEELRTFWPGLQQDRLSQWSGVPACGIGFQKLLENLPWKPLNSNH